jgi:peptide methionine sulfoxide reductase MsrA
MDASVAAVGCFWSLTKSFLHKKHGFALMMGIIHGMSMK